MNMFLITNIKRDPAACSKGRIIFVLFLDNYLVVCYTKHIGTRLHNCAIIKRKKNEY